MAQENIQEKVSRLPTVYLDQLESNPSDLPEEFRLEGGDDFRGPMGGRLMELFVKHCPNFVKGYNFAKDRIHNYEARVEVIFTHKK